MATGLPPGKTAVLISSITDHRGTDWRGEGHYEIRNDGTLNTAEDRSLGGTYSGIDVGGPFWSVQPPGGTAYLDGLKDTPDLPLSPAPNGLEPLRYDLTLVVDDETIGTETVVRPQLAEGV
ncbi:MAG: acyl-CoA thioesterase/BAAT N-terminal domain-containing protein, partial [Pseudomonadota bacterium]